jgi:hypothetical protein
MYAKDVRRLYKKLSKCLPEYCFLSDMIAEARECENRNKKIFLPNFDWSGNCSENLYEVLFDEIVPYIRGRIEASFYSENDSSIRVIIKDGIVIESEAEG